MFGALVAGAEFENHFQHMLFPDALPFAVRPRSVDTNHMSAIFGCIGHRWSFSGDSLFSRIFGCWGYLLILIVSDFSRRLGVSESENPKDCDGGAPFSTRK